MKYYLVFSNFFFYSCFIHKINPRQQWLLGDINIINVLFKILIEKLMLVD
jgi:hypothetical protein